MKIGLVRHYKVKHPFIKKFVISAEELAKWFEEYDAADIEYGHVELGDIEWNICYTSPLGRAVKTANHIFKSEITTTEDLKEYAALPKLNRRIKLPMLVWAILVRAKFFYSKRHANEFKSRILNFLDVIQFGKEENVLIVSHVFVMNVIQRELRNRGFVGNKFSLPEYGKVYIFERVGPGSA